MNDKDRIAWLEGETAKLTRRLIEYFDKPTLRDQFAMAALTGLLANSYSDGHSQPMCTAPAGEFSRWAYSQADAMMEARKAK